MGRDLYNSNDILVLVSFIFILFIFVAQYLRYGHRKKPSMERKILDALIEYGCVEQPPFTPRSATAREVAHLIYKRNEYITNPNHYDLMTTKYLINMEKFGDLGNSGEATDNPEIAMKKGRWYIKWHPPSE